MVFILIKPSNRSHSSRSFSCVHRFQSVVPPSVPALHSHTRDVSKPLVFEKATNFFDRLIGNKEEEARLQQEHEKWQPGDTIYSWLANGMLESVQNPDGKIVSFEYDALGRRTAKIAEKEINRYFWDGNVLIHEWKYDEKQRPQLIVVEDDLVYDKPEPIENLVTWVYEGGSFVPSAKIIGGEKFSIINDYIGRPVQAYSQTGDLVWETEYDIYGGLRNLKGDRSFIPFRQLGQYEDAETGLYYNRFRYYNPEAGLYLSQDPIGILGNNPNAYAYVHDSNSWIDPFGLSECKGLERLKKFRKNYDGTLKESRFNGHIDKHGMNHDVIKDILENPDNIYYHKNNNHLLFYKDGDVVVVSGKDSGIITAYGKSDRDGVYKELESITDKPAITLIE